MNNKNNVSYRAWKAAEPKACFLLVHGLGAHSGRWECFADFFLQSNVSSYAIELKGFGETKGLKGHIDSFNTYLNDIHSLYNIIAEENIGRKVFLAGESLGALIAFYFSIKKPDLFNGLVCISPAFRSRLKYKFLEYIDMLLSLLYNPKKQFRVPITSQMCTMDDVMQKTVDHDSREHRVATPKFLMCAVLTQIRANFFKSKVKLPVLFLLAGKDELVDTEASSKLFNALKVKNKELVMYPDMYHALSIEAGREKVFGDILDWVVKRP